MTDYSSAQVAKKLGITPAALSKYIKAKKVPAPRIVQVGKMKLQAWTEEEVEHLRQLLPKIANGRKTRYKKHSAVSVQRSAVSKGKTENTKGKKKEVKQKQIPHR